MLDHAVTYYEKNMDQEEIDCCKNVTNKDEHYRNQRLDRLEEAFDIAQNNPREENARQRMSGATCAPLLIGCVQFGSLTTIRTPIVRQELMMCG